MAFKHIAGSMENNGAIRLRKQKYFVGLVAH